MAVSVYDEKSLGCESILLIDDHPIVRLGLTQLINQQPDLMVCGEVESGQEALEAIAAYQPTLILVGLALQGADGLSMLKLICDHAPRTPLLVLSDYDETLYAVRALQAGARGYFPKRSKTEALIGAIRQVLRGDIAVSERLTSRLVQTAITGRSALEDTPVARLSNRELEVLRYVGQGLSTREIASTLCLSIKTVETHRSHIMKKLHLGHARDLIRYAVHWSSHLEQN